MNIKENDMDIKNESQARTLDEWESMRTAWLDKRTDTMLTSQQIEKGLTDKNWGIRMGWAECNNFTPTPEQIERGLNDMHWQVRISWAKRMDFTLTPEQIERGLKDVHMRIRVVYGKREDYTPTQEQIDSGFADVSAEVRQAWIDRLRKLTAKLLNYDLIEDCGIQSI